MVRPRIANPAVVQEDLGVWVRIPPSSPFIEFSIIPCDIEDGGDSEWLRCPVSKTGNPRN